MAIHFQKRHELERATATLPQTESVKLVGVRKNLHLQLDFPFEAASSKQFSPSEQSSTHRSPYEDLPIDFEESPVMANGIIRTCPKNAGKKRHPRGSHIRHTLGVDVNWLLKRLVTNKHSPCDENPASKNSSQIGQVVHRQMQEHNNHNITNLPDTPTRYQTSPAIREDQSNQQHLVNGVRNGGNFSLRKLRTIIRQTRDNICSSTYEISSDRNSPTISSNQAQTRRSVPSLGIASLKAARSPLTMEKRPTSTRV